MPEKEIILCLPNKNQTTLYQIFKENTRIPAKVLRRKIGRRNYERFRDQILTVNNYLKEKGILEPFRIYWTAENGREHKVIHKNENAIVETREKSIFITMQV